MKVRIGSVLILVLLLAGLLAPLAHAAGRPIIVLAEYVMKPNTVRPGQEFNLYMRFKNLGTDQALDLVVTIGNAEIFPRGAGGVYSFGTLDVNTSRELEQIMVASPALTGEAPVAMPVTISYADTGGNTYTESFTVVIAMGVPPTATSVYSGPPAPTASPTAATRPQLVVVAYTAQPDSLAPGTRFDLQLEVQNVGAANANAVLLVAGGAAVSPPSEEGGQPSVSGGDFSKFSPLGVSNIQAIGNVPAGQSVSATQPLIVNVTTEPGAYSFPISFVYQDQNNETRVDNQVITLLVYSPPNLDVSFYQPAGPFFAGQANFLPIQVVNLGRKTIVLGNLNVTAGGAFLENNAILIGALDPGGYYTLDTILYPDVEGPLTLTFTIDYTDDFNDPQRLTRTMEIMVEPTPSYYGPPEGYPTPPVESGEESGGFWQGVWRFLRGLLGLDSSIPDTDSGYESPYTRPDTPDGGGGGGGGGKSP